jgi:hypothetical protein
VVIDYGRHRSKEAKKFARVLTRFRLQESRNATHAHDGILSFADHTGCQDRFVAVKFRRIIVPGRAFVRSHDRAKVICLLLVVLEASA